MNKSYKFISAIMLLIAYPAFSFCQGTSYKPVSYQIFTPFVFNPAIAGSKDFSSLDFLFSSLGRSSSELLSYNMRIGGSNEKYSSSAGSPIFTNLGAGGYILSITDGKTRNISVNGTMAYHIQLDNRALSFLSVGISVRGTINNYAGDPDMARPAKTTVFPEADAGIYFYNANMYTGLSVTNIPGNPVRPDSLGFTPTQVTRQYFLLAGYKFLLSRSLRLLVEPSLTVRYEDSFSGKLQEIIKPGLKIYAGNFCAGTYFNDFKKVSFFIQSKYPIFYLGTYFELPVKSPYFRDPILAEITAGLNISALKSGISRQNHW